MKKVPFIVIFSASLAGVFAGWLYVRSLDEAQIYNIASIFESGETENFAGWAYFVLSALIVPLIMAMCTALGIGIGAVPLCMLGSGFSLSCAVSSLILSSGEILYPFFRCGLPNLISLPFVFLFAVRLFEASVVQKGRRGIKNGVIELPQAFAITVLFSVVSRLAALAVIKIVY